MSRAPYGPPALRVFTQTHDPQPQLIDIATERFRQRFNVRKDNNEQIHSGRQLHSDFCLSRMDRHLAFNEAIGDIEPRLCALFPRPALVDAPGAGARQAGRPS